LELKQTFDQAITLSWRPRPEATAYDSRKGDPADRLEMAALNRTTCNPLLRIAAAPEVADVHNTHSGVNSSSKTFG
jgi:hypothetical protein